ncbi:hypothetical protein B0H14DRAFT_2596040 [Mycena olivaceomarginata]|nr:hypothetical protein B0H14DRAFT_2596040 [Mycena olivaceomarginata]
MCQTDDDGCRFIAFPAGPLVRTGPVPHVTRWTLHGTGCISGAETDDGQCIVNSSQIQNQHTTLYICSLSKPPSKHMLVSYKFTQRQIDRCAPITVMPAVLLQQMTWVLIHFVRNIVTARVVPWPRSQYAWLFPDGTAVGRRLWVAVPL